MATTLPSNLRDIFRDRDGTVLRDQKGYEVSRYDGRDTSYWIIWWFVFILVLCFWGSVILAAWHFIAKFW